MAASPQNIGMTTDAEGVVPRGIRNGLLTIAIAAVLSFVLYWLLPYDEAANRGLALLLFVAILWFTEAVHISLTALMVPLLGVALFLPGTGPENMPTFSMAQTLNNFSNPIIFLFLVDLL
ncbi:hypothetical protein L0B52_05935 [Suttonella sp. R2A3]|nr:hypothetical protein [Suttonella sp. R2A3]UJF23886.1 hypothetical protein L0B52_05935 [Suttonella sp. R2A3]